jgi:hypothetical protein
MTCIQLDRRWAGIHFLGEWEARMYVAETLWRRAAIVHQVVIACRIERIAA